MKEHKFNNPDIIKLFGNDKEPFTVFSAPIAQVHKVTLDDEFRETYQFAHLCEVLDNAQEGDCVQIKLSTVGGALHSIIPLMASLKNTSAYTHVHVESDTASAGTFIMMLADSCYVNEYATVMCHNVNFGAVGHGLNVDAHVKHVTKTSDALIRDMYNDWLTEDEITLLQHGMEIYLTPDECHERFDKREEKRQAAYEAAVKKEDIPENVFKEIISVQEESPAKPKTKRSSTKAA